MKAGDSAACRMSLLGTCSLGQRQRAEQKHKYLSPTKPEIRGAKQLEKQKKVAAARKCQRGSFEL